MSLLKRLLGDKAVRAAPAVPAGHRVYAIGDIHGRDDLLERLLADIEADHLSRPPAELALVFLGDFIDRGPDSAGVVERLRSCAGRADRTVFLAGNHEEVLLRILDGEAQLIADWLRFGGAQCLASYGVDPAQVLALSPDQAVALIGKALPSAHVGFLRGLDDTFRAGDYLFVHAGIRPGLPLESQRRSDLHWIREPFLAHQADHGFVVVHGHTISEQVEEGPNRIGIDTGAYRTGVLTALGLEGGDRWYLQARLEVVRGPDGADRPTVPFILDGVGGQSG